MRSKITELLINRFSEYKKIVEKINDTKSNIGSDIELSCELIYKLEKFNFYEQVNKTTIGSEHLLNDFINGEYIKYDSIIDLFSKPLRFNNSMLSDNNEVNITMKVNVTFEDILKGLVKDNFEIEYSVKYQGDNLLHMSPGKKGTVLLILFLQMSSSEYPILIDQPEDNLDNRTIYDLLCKMIKDKKKDRQIIIVSHNANLVVATDAENIIVANQEGQESILEQGKYRFEYVNGALEHSFKVTNDTIPLLFKQGIREHVCDILEGGNEAFKQREKKYSIK